MTDATTEARALFAKFLRRNSMELAARDVENGASNLLSLIEKSALEAITTALSTPTPAGELREVVRRETIEECAKVAEGFEDPSRDWVNGSLWDGIKRDTATRIRALAQPGSGERV